MQTLNLTKSTIVVAVLVISMVAFRANLAYAGVTLGQADFSGSSSPGGTFTPSNSAMITRINFHSSNTTTPLANAGSLTLTETWGGTPFTLHISPTEDGPNDVTWVSGPIGVPTDPARAVTLGYDGPSLPAGTTFTGAVTYFTGTTTAVNEQYGKIFNFNESVPAGVTPFVYYVGGLSSPAATFIPTANVLVEGGEVHCDYTSQFTSNPLLEVNLTTNGGSGTYNGVANVPPSQLEAGWVLSWGFGASHHDIWDYDLPPIDPNSVVTVNPLGTTPTATCDFSFYGFQSATANPIDGLFESRLTGGKAVSGLTIQVATNSGSTVSLGFGASNYAWLVGTSAGCALSQSGAVGPVAVAITSEKNTSNWSVDPYQPSLNPYTIVWNGGPVGNPSDPGTTTSVSGPSVPPNSSCSTTGVFLTGAKGPVTTAELDGILLAIIFEEFAMNP